MEIARSFDLGFNEIAEANPSIDPWLPPEDIEIAIPTLWILPETLDNGIVINLAEMRLYYPRLCVSAVLYKEKCLQL